MSHEPQSDAYNVLSLDGGGAKGVYTIGVLRELESLCGERLGKVFNLIYGTSTGSIIAALLALGCTTKEVETLYFDLIPSIMGSVLRRPSKRSAALRKTAEEIFGNRSAHDFITGVGIVTTNWNAERPTIFKARVEQVHGRVSTFSAGFGCLIADAVVASCAAYPFFKKVRIHTEDKGELLLWDGGFCANNPTLFAIADARKATSNRHDAIRVLSVGCGSYPERTDLSRRFLSVVKPRHFLKVLNTSSVTIDRLRSILFPEIQCVRVSECYSDMTLATDLLETRIGHLREMRRLGCESFGLEETNIKKLLHL